MSVLDGIGIDWGFKRPPGVACIWVTGPNGQRRLSQELPSSLASSFVWVVARAAFGLVSSVRFPLRGEISAVLVAQHVLTLRYGRRSELAFARDDGILAARVRGRASTTAAEVGRRVGPVRGPGAVVGVRSLSLQLRQRLLFGELGAGGFADVLVLGGPPLAVLMLSHDVLRGLAKVPSAFPVERRSTPGVASISGTGGTQSVSAKVAGTARVRLRLVARYSAFNTPAYSRLSIKR